MPMISPLVSSLDFVLLTTIWTLNGNFNTWRTIGKFFAKLLERLLVRRNTSKYIWKTRVYVRDHLIVFFLIDFFSDLTNLILFIRKKSLKIHLSIFCIICTYIYKKMKKIYKKIIKIIIPDFSIKKSKYWPNWLKNLSLRRLFDTFGHCVFLCISKCSIEQVRKKEKKFSQRHVLKAETEISVRRSHCCLPVIQNRKRRDASFITKRKPDARRHTTAHSNIDMTRIGRRF